MFEPAIELRPTLGIADGGEFYVRLPEPLPGFC